MSAPFTTAFFQSMVVEGRLELMYRYKFGAQWHDLDDAAMQDVAGVRGVETITFDCVSKLTRKGMLCLTSLPVSAVEFNSCSVPPDAIAALKRVDSLRRLVVAAHSLGDPELAVLKSFEQLAELDLADAELTDTALSALTGGALEETVSSLGLSNNSKITDVGMTHVGGFSQLEELNLAGGSITDSGVGILAARSKGLKILNLASLTGVTGFGLDQFGDSGALQDLNLAATGVDDDGLELGVSALANTLRELSLGDATGFSRKGFSHVGKLTGLRLLDVQNAGQVQGDWLEELAPLKGSLEELRLDGTGVGNAGLGHLQGFTGLNYLGLWKTKVTQLGVQAVRRWLPKTRVHA